MLYLLKKGLTSANPIVSTYGIWTLFQLFPFPTCALQSLFIQNVPPAYTRNPLSPWLLSPQLENWGSILKIQACYILIYEKTV